MQNYHIYYTDAENMRPLVILQTILMAFIPLIQKGREMFVKGVPVDFGETLDSLVLEIKFLPSGFFNRAKPDAAAPDIALFEGKENPLAQ